MPRPASSVRQAATNASCSMCQAVGQRHLQAPVDRRLGEAVRHHRPRGELGRPRERGLEDVVRCHDPVHQPDRLRLLGPHLAPREDHLLGPRRADQPRQPLGAAPAGDDAEQDLGQPEARVVGADPEVEGQRQLEATAQRVAVDRGDRRPRDGGQRVERGGEVVARPPPAPIPSSSTMSAPAAKIRRRPTARLRPADRPAAPSPPPRAGPAPPPRGRWPSVGPAARAPRRRAGAPRSQRSQPWANRT